MVGQTEQCGHLQDVLTLIPVSNGFRDGLTWDLITDVELSVCEGYIVELGFE